MSNWITAETGMFIGVNNEVYHADRTRVSKSWLDRVAQSPLHLRQYLDNELEKTLALIIGSAVDCLVFEPELFDKQFVKGPTDSKRSKAGKEVWAGAYEDAEKTGRTIIECHNQVNYWDQCHETAEAIMGNPKMREILVDGVGQAVFVGIDETTGLKTKCKTDNYHEASNTVCDLKTAACASPYEFARSIASYRYHVQDAYYSDIIAQVTGDQPNFFFAVMEKPPTGIAPDSGMMAFYELSEREKLAGRNTYQSDLMAIAFAMDTGNWGGYADEVITIERPAWAQNRDQ